MAPVGQTTPARRRFRDTLRALLARRQFPLLAALLGVLLCLPALCVGLVADDFFHRAALTGSRLFGEFVHSPLDMFAFFDGDAARTHRMMDFGFMPWWVYPGMKASFWRPLTVLTHWLDYRLWPAQPWLMHAQSLAWYGVLVAAVALLYRRLMPAAWIAGLAALLYAVDDAHSMPVAFLANRNALLSTLLGVLALLAHDVWRRGGRRSGAVLGPLLLLLSLLAKEEGVATCAYLFAYAVCLETGPRARRAAALLPYAVIVIGWRIVWAQLGYGVADVGFYVDPLREPLRFLHAVAERAPYLLLGQWAAPPAEICIMGNVVGATLVHALWWAGSAAAAALVWLLYPLVRRDRLARFWTLGMLLAFLPACSTFPADRMLLFVGLGAMGLVAQLLTAIFAAPGLRRRTLRIAGGTLVVLHLVIAPVALSLRTLSPAGPKFAEQFAMQAPLDAAVEHQDLVILNPPSLLHAAYFPVQREFAGQPVPRCVRYLGSGLTAMTIRRPDECTLVIGIDGGYIGWTFERLFRDERHPMTVGERVILTRMVATVTAVTADGRPAEASFRFDVPLEDASLRWLWWHAGEFRPFTPPAVGQTLEIPPAVLRWW